MTIHPVNWTDPHQSHEALKPVIRHRRGATASIRQVECRLLAGRATGLCYRIAVTLQDDTVDHFFLKDLSWKTAGQRKGRRLRRRELIVYRDLLANLTDNAPRYVWSAWDESRNQYWLLLEWVEGEPLRSGDQAGWIATARWLARLQGQYARHSHGQSSSPALQRHDAAFFTRALEEAWPGVQQLAPDLAGWSSKILGRAIPELERVAFSAPTLVHGELVPSHVLVSARGASPRLHVVDWEQAALGSGLYDLAMLGQELDEARQQALWLAYDQEAAGCGLPRLPPADARFARDCFQLIMAIVRLGKAGARGYSDRQIAQWIARSEELVARLDRPSRHPQPGAEQQ